MRKVNHRKIVSLIKHRAKRVLRKMQGKQFVHVLHIGKTGGSSLKYVLRHYSASSHYEICLHSHRVKLSDIPKGESVILILRDPLSRFVSGFYSRQRLGQPKYFVPWSLDEKIAFEHFNTPNELATALSSLDAQEKRKAQMAMKSIKHVKSSYWNWFESEEYFKSRLSDIFFIAFQESLTEDFEILKSRLGLPQSAELPRDEAQAHKNPTNLNRTLDDTSIANLRNWYKDEFEFINLCQEIILKHPDKGSSIIARLTKRA